MKKKQARLTVRRRSALLCCVLLLALVSATALASFAPVDLSRSCSLTVSLPGGEFGEDAASAGVQVDLYRVADAKAVPGHDTLRYESVGAFAGMQFSDQSDTESWERLAAEAEQIVREKLSSLTPAASAAAGSEMTDLPAGVYVAIAHGAALTDYFKEIKDEDGKTVLVSTARSALYEYQFEPELIALPTKEPDENGNINTAGSGEWLYGTECVLKASRERRLGDLEIVKTLKSYLAPENALFIFSVTVTLDGVKSPARVYSLNFTDAGIKSLVIRGIPAGASVEIREIYGGAVYTAVGDTSKTVIIEADALVSAGFTNEYSDTGRSGHGVENHFTLGEDGWIWEKRADSSGKQEAP